MKQIKSRLQDGIRIFTDSHHVYKRLQQHLNKQPIGFPASMTGVERRLLSGYFTMDEAEIALFLSYKGQSVDQILKKVKHLKISQDQLQAMLDHMEKNGALFVNIIDGHKHYALAPFAIGMANQKLPKVDANFVLDYRKYAFQSYAMEYLSTSHPQARVIPIQKAVPPGMHISTYDEIRALMRRNEGRISLNNCFCRIGKDKIGQPCQVTDRREVGFAVGDLGAQYIRNGIGRGVSSDEALKILAENEKEGLVLQTSNCQDTIWICSCCKCCCGPLELLSFHPKPAEFIGSNFYAALDPEKCTGDGGCGPKCVTEAITMKDQKAVHIDLNRCLGCGVCVASCESGALSLKKKSTAYTPPKNMDILLEEIMKSKKSAVGRVCHLGWKFMGK